MKKHVIETSGKRHRNRKGLMSDSEIMMILILFHTSHYRDLKTFYLGYICHHMNKEFPNRISYNRFVERQTKVALNLLLFFQTCALGKCTGISIIDSTPLTSCHIKREHSHKTMKGWAQKGKCTMGWFYGFKLHLVINDRGEVIQWMLTHGNVDDREPLKNKEFTMRLFGKLFADRGYISQNLFEELFIKDFTDFNTMVERMNAPVKHEGVNPFPDGKMTGFRKWALDNGAKPEKILEAEQKYSKNNWEALKEYEKADGFSAGGREGVLMNKYETDFNQVFPHEVEHRLFAELFGDGNKNITLKEVIDAFKPEIFQIDNMATGGKYFIENDFEELLPRFTQIKNALGITEQRALTEGELRQAYKMLENGYPRIANNNMMDFFDNIKDWKAAAKLSGKALGIGTALGITLKTFNNGNKVQNNQ